MTKKNGIGERIEDIETQETPIEELPDFEFDITGNELEAQILGQQVFQLILQFNQLKSLATGHASVGQKDKADVVYQDMAAIKSTVSRIYQTNSKAKQVKNRIMKEQNQALLRGEKLMIEV